MELARKKDKKKAPDADYCKAFINNRKAAAPKSRPASRKLTIGEEEGFNWSTCTAPPQPSPSPSPSPSPPPRISSSPPSSNHLLPEHAIENDDNDNDNEEEEKDDDGDDDDESDSFSTDTLTSPSQDDGKTSDETGSGKPAPAPTRDFSFNFSRRHRQQSGPAIIKPTSALMVSNELSVFGPSSGIEPSHTIRQRMMTREFRGGLGPNIGWERKEKRMMARAHEHFFGRCRCHRRCLHRGDGGVTEEGPPRRTTEGENDCLKDTLVSDHDHACNNQFVDAMDYHARGW